MPRGPQRPLRHEHDLPGPVDGLAAGELAQPAEAGRIGGELQCRSIKIARLGPLVEQLRQAARPRRPGRYWRTVIANAPSDGRNRYVPPGSPSGNPTRRWSTKQSRQQLAAQASLSSSPRKQCSAIHSRRIRFVELSDRFHDACSAGRLSRIWRMIVSG